MKKTKIGGEQSLYNNVIIFMLYNATIFQSFLFMSTLIGAND